MMRGKARQEKPPDVEFYTRSQTQLRRLKSQLPEGSVEDLAREVIGRLNARHGATTADTRSDTQIEQLAHSLVADNEQAGAELIQRARSDGASMESVYLIYLAGAAQKLGEWWDKDLVTFAEVTLGASRIYAIMRTVRRQLPVATGVTEKKAFFASVPGETHTLGVRMAADLFRKNGWQIVLKMGETHDGLVEGICKSTASVMGFSAAGIHSLDDLTKLIVATRIERPDAAIIVSGQVLEKAQDTVALLDIDGSAKDIETARTIMEDLHLARQDSR